MAVPLVAMKVGLWKTNQVSHSRTFRRVLALLCKTCSALGLHTTALFRGRQGRATDKFPYWRAIRQPKRPHDAPSSALKVRNMGQVAPIFCFHMSFLCRDWVPVPNEGAQPPPAASCRPPWKLSLRDALLTPFWGPFAARSQFCGARRTGVHYLRKNMQAPDRPWLYLWGMRDKYIPSTIQ